ncbi:MAG: restriction endonuclease [Spirochaetes bacterium]|nr:restriction endonuclease [Spirochaetota bacterium]
MISRSKLNADSTILVKKASGEEEPFSKYKLERSLRNAGADNDSVKEISDEIFNHIYNGITTRKIYSGAFTLLRRKKNLAALRYKLKRSIFELGPTGYPFEHLVGQIFEKQGYGIEVGRVIEGVCVSHEMDVIASGNNKQHLIECKYSKDQGKQVSIQVPLYVRSRVDDIIKKRKELPEYDGFSFFGCIVTNTRFSADSIEYGICSGLHLIGWDYPEGNGLKEIIEREKIFPVTVLNFLTKNHKQYLMDKGIITCSQLSANAGILNELRLSKNNSVMNELDDICR